MSVKVGSARIDENGKAKGGKAGDQTGKEVSTQSWYLHSKGWKVFRAKDPDVAEKIAQDMEYACSNKNIGYDQGQRGTLYKVSEPYGFNCRMVTTPCETDCSALVRVCCAYAGVMLPNFRTTDEGKVLLNSGQFVQLSESKYTTKSDYLKRGDILVTKTQGHTVVVLTNGPKSGGIDPTPDYKGVKVTGGSVNVRTAPGVEGSKILGVVHKCEILPYQGITSQTINGYAWYLVVYKNENAWISGKYSMLVE